MIDQIAPLAARPGPEPGTDRTAALREAARDLEAAFLSEMLKGAGVGARKGEFGGGQGEDQFASMLRDQQSRQMVEAGGIGLAERLFQSLVKRETRDA